MAIIHFAHANGFPALTYRRIFGLLGDEFEIGYVERHGHDPQYPVTDNWRHLKEELRDTIAARYREPVFGVGHSLGGVLHFMVACENPELYRGIVLLDAPIISRLSSHGLKVMKLTRLMDRLSPAHLTRFRRNLWPSRADALSHFASKPKFAAWDPGVLADYIEFGTVETNRGVELFFSPRVEAQIYRTIPDHLPRYRGRLSVPATYIGGSDSREGRLARLSFMRRHFPVEYIEIEGSHLYPMESPLETAAAIRRALRN